MKVLYDHQIFSSQVQGGVSRYFSELLASDASDWATVAGWDYSRNVHLAETQAGRYRDWWPSIQFKGKAHLTGWWNRRVSVKAFRSKTWDLAHPTYYDPYFLRYLDGRPFVLTIHDMTHELFPLGLSDAGVTPQRKALLAHRATQIIAVSENTRQDAIRLLGVSPEKIVTVPHGNSLIPSRVQPAPQAYDSPYWLYVGHRAGYKNWDRLVDALAQRRDSGDHLVMVGGGTLSVAERALLDAAGLVGRYRQTAASEAQLAGWYSGARALVYPSYYEGFGLPLLEAMAWDCPVVAARASSLPEVAGEAAVWFDPSSTDELVHALASVDQAALRNRLISLGRERQSHFTWNQTRKKTGEVYRRALAT